MDGDTPANLRPRGEAEEVQRDVADFIPRFNCLGRRRRVGRRRMALLVPATAGRARDGWNRG
jgi:hypothetical protein